MKSISIKILTIIHLCVLTSAFCQDNAENAYALLDEIIGSLNPATDQKVILAEYASFIQMYPDSPFEDEILFKTADIYGQNGNIAHQLLMLIKLNILHYDSPLIDKSMFIIDTISTYHVELFTKKENDDAIKQLSKLPNATNYRSAYLEFLSFLHFSKIQALNNLLLEELSIYRNLFRDEPKDNDAINFWKAETHNKLGHYNQALLYYKNVSRLYPNSSFVPASLLSIARIYSEKYKKYDLASEYLFNLINQYPDVPETAQAQFRLAEIFEKHYKDINEAFAYYKVLIQSFPESEFYIKALSRGALITENKLHFGEAINYNRLIIESSQNEEEVEAAFLRIAIIQYEKLKQPLLAAQTYTTLANTYPGIPQAPGYLLKAALIYSNDLNNSVKSKELLEIIINKYMGSKAAKRAREIVSGN